MPSDDPTNLNRAGGELRRRRPLGRDLSRRDVLKLSAAVGGLAITASTPAFAHTGGTGSDDHVDLSTGTTNFTPDAFGTTDDDWQVTNSPDGTTGQAVSIRPHPAWATHPNANWIDPYGTGGQFGSDPVGVYTYETDFRIGEEFEGGICQLRLHRWSVDDKARDEEDGTDLGIYLDGPGGTQEVTTGCCFANLHGPVGPILLDPGDYTLRVEAWNNQTLHGLLVYADVLCIEVEIDIKPCSDPNAINPDNNGVIPVGIKGTDHFDPPSEIDVDSLRFGAPDEVDSGGGAEAAHGGHREDVVPCDGDGVDDLVVHFPTEDTGFEQGDDRGKLVGVTVDGFEFNASDTVKIVGGGGPGGP